MASDSDELIGHITSQIADAVKAGRTPDEAARRLALIVPAKQVQLALDAYRSKVKRLRDTPGPTGIYNRVTEPWYSGPDADDKLWQTFRSRLKEKGWSDEAIRKLDEASTRVVALLEPPSKGKIQTRGLVVGYVQSGKTANFTAVISKAADAGYRFFIVLSGLNNSLRVQTQQRLEADLGDPNKDTWIWATEPDNDFRARGNVNAYLSARHSTKTIAVVKKHAGRLRRLIAWLTSARSEVLRTCPILVIDDEADQASPNAHPDPKERTAINDLVRRLLQSAPKIGYVGYTATPFANLLIDPTIPDDLYPRDFIVDLPSNDEYFGAAEIFGRAPRDEDDVELPGLNMIRKVTEIEAYQLKPVNRQSRYDFKPPVLPVLEEAISYFLLATSARLARGQRSSHSSMLIHTTQYSVVHSNARDSIFEFLNSIRARFSIQPRALEQELRAVWELEQVRLPPESVERVPVSFNMLWPHFADTLERCEVKVENGVSSDRIDYEHSPEEQGRIYIVIGGNVLSRGLTLEGLVVSFFVRSASAYDTLLQMGRWFGYRHGYEDLPRVWMTEEIEGFFYDMASVEREIRVDIDRYSSGEVTPREFAVRIRTHPALAITAPAKMQASVPAEIAFNGRYLQTIVFNESPSHLEGNRQAADGILRAVSHTDNIKPTFRGNRPNPVFLNVASTRVLKFLEDYSIDNANATMPAAQISGYIRAQNKLGRLEHWNVAVVTRRSPLTGLGEIELEGVGKVPLVSRARFLRERAPGRVDIKALMSESDVAIDVDRSSTELRGMERYDLLALRDAELPDRGLLLLYPIAKNSEPPAHAIKRALLGTSEHVIGLALVFPQILKGDITPQSYVTVALKTDGSEEFEIEDLTNIEEL